MIFINFLNNFNIKNLKINKNINYIFLFFNFYIILYKDILHNLSSAIKTNTNPPSHLCDLLNENFFPQLELLIGDTMDLCPSTLRIPALRLK